MVDTSMPNRYGQAGIVPRDWIGNVAMSDDIRYDPPNVGLDSRGTAINPLLRWLDKWAKSKGYEHTGIEIDEHFGGVGLRWLHMFQAAEGLRVTRAFDAETRAKALSLGFDYAAEAKRNRDRCHRLCPARRLAGLVLGTGFEADEDRAIVCVQINDAFTT